MSALAQGLSLVLELLYFFVGAFLQSLELLQFLQLCSDATTKNRHLQHETSRGFNTLGCHCLAHVQFRLGLGLGVLLIHGMNG